MAWSRRLLTVLVGVALVAVSCSGDDDTEATGTSETETSVTETTETSEAAPTETSEDTTTTTAATEDSTEDSASGESLAVELGEWYVDMPATLEAGSISFDISNADPERPHALAVVRGDAYENLPQLDNGAVDTEAMGDDFLGTTENIEPGQDGAISFDLEAGNYVFFCPINFGPNSHARAGQVLSVTVG